MTDFQIDKNFLFKGFLNTHNLWDGDAVCGLKQFKIVTPKPLSTQLKMDNKLRLGKLVEQLTFDCLNQDQKISLLFKNTQIKKGKITIGELDCILMKDGNPIHLEIVYKFYLYDPNVGTSEIDHWIGPNRKDSLSKKIKKLKNKQLPLLFHESTKDLLASKNLSPESIEQLVMFKAQLFVPYHHNVEFELINEDCVSGYYLPFSKLENLHGCQFYIPSKLNWLSEIRSDVNWTEFDTFMSAVHEFVNQKRSPLCWVKTENQELKKIFITWWE